MVGNTHHPGLLLPVNTHPQLVAQCREKLPRQKQKPVLEADTASQTFLFLCGGVDIGEKIICSDSILASFTLPVIADDYFFSPKSIWSSTVIVFLKINLYLQWGGLSSLLVIPPTLQKPAHLIANPLCRFSKSVPA